MSNAQPILHQIHGPPGPGEYLAGNRRHGTSSEAWDGNVNEPPRWPHFVQRRLLRSNSLEASAPQRIINGASGTATHRRHLPQFHQTQCGSRFNADSVGTRGGSRKFCRVRRVFGSALMCGPTPSSCS